MINLDDYYRVQDVFRMVDRESIVTMRKLFKRYPNPPKEHVFTVNRCPRVYFKKSEVEEFIETNRLTPFSAHYAKRFIAGEFAPKLAI